MGQHRPLFISLMLNGWKLVRCDVPSPEQPEVHTEFSLEGYTPPAVPPPHDPHQRRLAYKYSCVLSVPSAGSSSVLVNSGYGYGDEAGGGNGGNGGGNGGGGGGGGNRGGRHAAATSAAAAAAATAAAKPSWVVLLEFHFDGDSPPEVYSIGSVSGDRQLCHATVYLDKAPSSAVLSATEVGGPGGRQAAGDKQPSTTDSETLHAQKQTLLACVRRALADDKVNPRQGSLTATLIDSKARECPAYAEVVEAYPNGFIGFIEDYTEDFTLFNYTQDEIEGREMKEHAHANELRIVLKKGKRVQFCSEDEEKELLAFLKEILAERDMECDELLLRIHEAGVGFSVSPCFSQLMRFLSRNTDLFSWSTDPSQITTVSFAGDDEHTFAKPPRRYTDRALRNASVYIVPPGREQKREQQQQQQQQPQPQPQQK